MQFPQILYLYLTIEDLARYNADFPKIIYLHSTIKDFSLIPVYKNRNLNEN